MLLVEHWQWEESEHVGRRVWSSSTQKAEVEAGSRQAVVAAAAAAVAVVEETMSA